MKCRVCRGPAVIDLPRHNAHFCAEHFLRLCRDQVTKAIERFSMMQPGERVLVAVSGGKDSLALWDLLLDLGYDVDGLYLGLGIGDYSDESGTFAACLRGVPRAAPRGGRPPGRPRLRRAHRGAGHQARAVLGLRHVEAPPVRPGRSRGRLRRAGHGAQPGRRSGRAVRQHAAMGHRVPRPPAAGAARAPWLPPEGEAARAPHRAGDRGLLRAPGDRLPGRGVPHGGREQAPRLQGRPQRRRGHVARRQGGLLLRVPGAGRAAVRPAVGRRAGRAPAVRVVRRAHHLGRVRLLPAGRQGPRRTRPSRSPRPRSRRRSGDGRPVAR